MSTPILVWAHRASLTRHLLMNKVSEPSQNSWWSFICVKGSDCSSLYDLSI